MNKVLATVSSRVTPSIFRSGDVLHPVQCQRPNGTAQAVWSYRLSHGLLFPAKGSCLLSRQFWACETFRTWGGSHWLTPGTLLVVPK